MPALEEELKTDCPFTEPPPPDKDEEAENAAKDDTEQATVIQKNNGGLLGDNLTDASEGDPATINDYYRCGSLSKDPVKDTRTDKNLTVTVQGQAYPFIQAAHHLIPGVASLEKSELYKSYMKKGAKVSVKGKDFTLSVNIGYNVNGAHNGVWLPGNYAIRADNPANHKKANWGVIADPDFKFHYMVAAMRKAGGRQFHDAHSHYNRQVKDTLDKISTKLVLHQATCKVCESKSGDKIPPPFRIKKRLYLLSSWLKTEVTGGPGNWDPKRSYFTSGPLMDAMSLPSERSKLMDVYGNAE